ncbi:hypothetical protein [Promicromonospora sp. NPDC023987]|uniref:hypothetical protein n=1 Tax=Promicromonospora sp. NPDC023987 TaxID=3155360 RepID=UPI0033CF9EE9
MAVTALAAATLTAAPSAAAQPETLTVDFGTTTGEFRGGATGTLYGFGDEGVPTQALINGAHITNSSQKPPFGTQHPSGDILQIENGFFAKHGEELAIYIQDHYPDWPYHRGVRVGDVRTYDQATGEYVEEPNGVWDYLEVVELMVEVVAMQSDHPEEYLFIPFNEPDGIWYQDWSTMRETFLADWKVVHDKIQEVYARHGLAPARIGGPGDARWQSERSRDFLTFAKQNDVLPDVFIWHELGIENLATFRSHLADYRALERELGVAPIHVNITEYGMLRDMGVPGQLIQWFSMFEDAKVDSQTAYWNYAGNFSDNSARPNGANGGWWLFKWYGDLAGSQTVRVTPPELDVADTLQGIGAIDAANRRATVLYGGTDSDVRLDLRGLSPAVFGRSVDVEVREVTLSGAEGLAGTPRVVHAVDGARVANNGTLGLTVPTYDRYAAYQVVVTPAQDRAVTVDPVWTTSIEAEDTDLTAARTYFQDPRGNGGWKFLASGSNDVGSFNQPSSKADWTVTVPRTGTYRFQVIGATPGKPGRHALFVDGAHRTDIQYTADLALTDTSRWQYRGSAEVGVPLTAGTHVLSVRASRDGSKVLPNSDITLDKFSLTDVTDGEPTTYPASTLRYYGGAGLGWDAGTRGFGSIAGRGQRADVYLNAMETGYYDVAVEFHTAGASDLRLDLGGRTLAEVAAPNGGHRRTTVRAHLTEGINELELRSDHGARVRSVTVTRAPDGDAAASTFEAEDLLLSGDAAVASVDPASGSNASGGKYVGWVGDGDENHITVPRGDGFDAPGDYDLVVHYANAETAGEHDYNPQVVDRQAVVTEGGDGTPVGSAFFRYTYSWDSFWQRTIPVTLTTDTGDLRLGNPTAWAPNIDKVTVAPLTVGTPKTTRTR